MLADTFVAYGGQTWADPKPHNFACTDAEEKGVPIVDSWIKMGPEQNNYEGPAHVRRNPPAPAQAASWSTHLSESGVPDSPKSQDLEILSLEMF